jgi:hypothetical protein
VAVSLSGGHCGEGGLGGRSERSVNEVVQWGARRGERKREAFGVERKDDARGRGKPRCGQNPWAVCDSPKTVTQLATAVRTGAARSKTDPGSMTVALGRAQFGAQSFFQLFKNCSNFVIQIATFPNSKNVQICKLLDMNLINNFVHWPNFRIPQEFKLQYLEQTPL